MGIRQEIKALQNGRFTTFASWYSNVDTYPCTVQSRKMMKKSTFIKDTNDRDQSIFQ
jgi:hypothetical protein